MITRKMLSLPLFMLVLLAGCSATRLTYNNADWLLKRELIKHTCPTEAQQEWLSSQMKVLHRWHRQKELPRYARALRRLAGALNRPLAKPAVDAFFAEMEGARQRFNQRLSAPAGAYLEKLAKPQIRCLIRRLDRWNSKSRKELGRSDARYVEAQREKLEDRLDDWMGDFTNAQRSAVDRLIGARKQTHRQMVTAWHNWGRRLVTLMRDRKGAAPRAKRLQAAVRDRFALYSSAERKVVRRWERQSRELTRAVVRLMTPAQRKKLKEKVTQLATDFTALAGQR